MVPFYIRYMGAEAYGLIGFFAMLQAWFQLLDIGLTPTMARETALFRGGGTDAASLRRLLRALEGVFVCVGVLGAGILTFYASVIAGHWLKVERLALTEVEGAITLMSMIVAMRWMCGLYRAAISGFERLVWLNVFNSAIATARFVLVVPILIYGNPSPTLFFQYQLFVAIVELIVLATQTYRLLPKFDSLVINSMKSSGRESLRRALKFSMRIAFTSSVWVALTQTDKLILSKLLPLTEYAYFTLAVLVASGVMIVSMPISGALISRLTRLHAEGNDKELLELYRNCTQLVAVAAIPASLLLALFPAQILWAWTGSSDAAQRAAPILTLYALGNGMLALGAFPAYLQFAKGDLKLHVVGHALFLFLLVPTLIWATWMNGVIGAGYAWLGANVLYFFLWLPRVHERFYKDLHRTWLLQDVGPVLLSAICGAVLGYVLVKCAGGWPSTRIPMIIWIAFIGTLTVIAAASASRTVRHRAKQIAAI